MNRDPKNGRELLKELRDLGAAPDRQKGSHQVWRFDDGEIFPVVVNHLADPVDKNILARFRRLRARRREPDEPSLLGGRGLWWVPSRPSNPEKEGSSWVKETVVAVRVVEAVPRGERQGRRAALVLRAARRRAVTGRARRATRPAAAGATQHPRSSGG